MTDTTTPRPATAIRPRRATSYDVARAAGVAQSTVSRCFQDDSSISPETRENVLRIAAELGYTRNAIARSLITQRSNMICVVASKFTMRNNPELIFLLGAALRNHGMSLLLVVAENDAAVSDSLKEAFEYPLDGIVCCSAMPRADAERFIKRGVPVVYFNCQVDFAHVDCIGTDNARAAGQLAEALVEAGHRRFLCMGGPEWGPVSRTRAEAFLARLSALRIRDVDVVPGNSSYDGGREAFRDIAASISRPDAVFCVTDQLAMGVMDACRFDLGWRVPDDISVVGFDDIPESARPTYDLCTVRQHVEIMAERAVEMLRLRLADPGRPGESVLIGGQVIVRSSARMAIR